MFIRRFYYDRESGAGLRTYTAEGARLKDVAPEVETARWGIDNWGLMEWTEKDDAVEAAFAPIDGEGKPRLVRPYVEDGELKFEYTPIGSEGADGTAAAALELIDILTGEVE